MAILLNTMKYPSTNITFGGMEDKGLTVKIKDSNNPKTHWVVWKADYENKDQDSEAYSALQNMKLGETFGVTYAEKDKSFTGREGNVITYKERTIYNVLPPVANPEPIQNTSQAQKPHHGANNASESLPTMKGASGGPLVKGSDDFSRRLGVQGHINALLSNPNVLNGHTAELIPGIVAMAIAIEDEAEKQLNPSSFRQAVQKHA